MKTARLSPELNMAPLAGCPVQNNSWRLHCLARWMLLNVSDENRPGFVKKSGAVDTMKHYLTIHQRAMKVQSWVANNPNKAPFEPFIFWWQSGIDELGGQFFEITAAGGHHWNASNHWELRFKPAAQVAPLALFLDKEKQNLLAFMYALQDPVQAAELCRQLDADIETPARTWPAELATLSFQLLATYTGF